MGDLLLQCSNFSAIEQRAARTEGVLSGVGLVCFGVTCIDCLLSQYLGGKRCKSSHASVAVASATSSACSLARGQCMSSLQTQSADDAKEPISNSQTMSETQSKRDNYNNVHIWHGKARVLLRQT